MDTPTAVASSEQPPIGRLLASRNRKQEIINKDRAVVLYFFVSYSLIFQSFLNFSGVLFAFSYSVKLFFQKTLAFFSAWDYTFLRQSNKGFAPQNQIFDSSGQGAIPYRRYSPRADAIRRKHDSVKFRSRQYSLDERRMRGKTFRLFAVLKC